MGEDNLLSFTPRIDKDTANNIVSNNYVHSKASNFRYALGSYFGTNTLVEGDRLSHFKKTTIEKTLNSVIKKLDARIVQAKAREEVFYKAMGVNNALEFSNMYLLHNALPYDETEELDVLSDKFNTNYINLIKRLVDSKDFTTVVFSPITREELVAQIGSDILLADEHAQTVFNNTISQVLKGTSNRIGDDFETILRDAFIKQSKNDNTWNEKLFQEAFAKFAKRLSEKIKGSLEKPVPLGKAFSGFRKKQTQELNPRIKIFLERHLNVHLRKMSNSEQEGYPKTRLINRTVDIIQTSVGHALSRRWEEIKNSSKANKKTMLKNEKGDILQTGMFNVITVVGANGEVVSTFSSQHTSLTDTLFADIPQLTAKEFAEKFMLGQKQELRTQYVNELGTHSRAVGTVKVQKYADTEVVITSEDKKIVYRIQIKNTVAELVQLNNKDNRTIHLKNQTIARFLASAASEQENLLTTEQARELEYLMVNMAYRTANKSTMTNFNWVESQINIVLLSLIAHTLQASIVISDKGIDALQGNDFYIYRQKWLLPISNLLILAKHQLLSIQQAMGTEIIESTQEVKKKEFEMKYFTLGKGDLAILEDPGFEKQKKDEVNILAQDTSSRFKNEYPESLMSIGRKKGNEISSQLHIKGTLSVNINTLESLLKEDYNGQ